MSGGVNNRCRAGLASDFAEGDGRASRPTSRGHPSAGAIRTLHPDGDGRHAAWSRVTGTTQAGVAGYRPVIVAAHAVER